MCLPDQCPYTDYSHISTIGLLAELYMPTAAVKCTSADEIEYVYHCQPIDVSCPAQDLSYLKDC